MTYDENTASKINEYFQADKSIRVAVYYRKNRKHTEQISSDCLKEKYYREFIEKQPNWIYSGIYIDESVKSQVQFNAMIADAKAGKFDLVIIKSISRFNRNFSDCISAVRDLLRLKKPVGIYFEGEGLCTLNPQTDMLLSYLSIMAIAESENKGKRIGCVFPKPFFLD